MASYIIFKWIVWDTTMKKIIRGFFCVILIGAIWGESLWGNCSHVQAEEFEEQLYATSAVLMDAASGRVLYGKNADTPMAMASTTKIMTCILVLELGNLEDMLDISSYASSMPKVKLYVKQGENYRVGDLLYSLMLESHNDSAVALAEYVGKQYLEENLCNKSTMEYTVEESKRAVEAFAVLMNEKAAELGCKNTWFITPNGLDATQTITLEDGETIQKEHCTTAEELARIMSYCITKSPKKEEFLEITRTPSYSFSANGRSYNCNNHNAFLSMMTGALSGKTGFTNKAGYCYVGALERDGRIFVVALLACGWPNNKNYKWSDTRKLMEYGLEQYTIRSFLSEDIAYQEENLGRLLVKGGQTKRLGDEAYTDLAILERANGFDQRNAGQTIVKDNNGLCGLLMREDEQVKVECEMKSVLEAPLKKGTVVGYIYYSVEDVIYRQETIVVTQNVEKIDYKWCLRQVWRRFRML